MIRIIFENGGIAEFNNVEKIYIEEKDYSEKVTIVDKIVPIDYADDKIKRALKKIQRIADEQRRMILND